MYISRWNSSEADPVRKRKPAVNTGTNFYPRSCRPRWHRRNMWRYHNNHIIYFLVPRQVSPHAFFHMVLTAGSRRPGSKFWNRHVYSLIIILPCTPSFRELLRKSSNKIRIFGWHYMYAFDYDFITTLPRQPNRGWGIGAFNTTLCCVHVRHMC